VKVLGPNDRKGNLEALREDWTTTVTPPFEQGLIRITPGMQALVNFPAE
jgi:hypothetical protein